MSRKFKLSAIVVLVTLSFIALSVALPQVQAQSSFSVYALGETETTISLEWSAYTPAFLNNILNYIVYFSTSGVNGPFESYSMGPYTLNTTFVNLNPDTNYWFYVEVIQGNGFGSSNATTTTIQVQTAHSISLQYTSTTQTTISLSWTDYNSYSSLTTFQSYTVQMMTQSGPWSTLTTLTSPADTTYTVTGLSPGTFYSFRVYDTVYVSGVGTFSSTSNVASASTVSNMNVMISASSTSIDVGGSLQFMASVSGGVGPYTYQWYVNGNPVSGATSSEFTFSPTTAGTYSVYLVVQDSTGTSDTSNSITVTVNNSITPVGQYSNSDLPLIIIVIVVIIALIGIAMALSMSKKKRMKT